VQAAVVAAVEAVAVAVAVEAQVAEEEVLEPWSPW
jgi:hypothetical protein